MKKLILAALALAVASFVGILPYFFGLKTEQVLRARLSEASTKGQVRFEVLKYDRGYLSSRFDVLISLDFLGEVANAEPETQKLTRLLFQGTVHHGPLTLSAGPFEGENAPAMAIGAMDGALFFEQEPLFYQMFFGQSPLLACRAVVGPTGDADLKVKGQRLFYEAPDKSIRIDWKGFLARANVSGDRLKGSVEGEGLAAASMIGEFDLFGYRSSFDLTRHPTGYYLGSQSMTMDGVAVRVSGQNLFKAGKLKVDYDSGAEGSLMTFTSAVDFSRFDVGSRTFGPMLLKTVGRNIDLNGVKMLEQAYRDALVNYETGKKSNPEVAEPPDGGARQRIPSGVKLGDDIVAALKTIASQAPSIEVPGFSLESPEGSIKGNVRMGVNPMAKIDFDNPESVESALYMDFKLTVPKSLAVEFMKLNTTQDARKRLLLRDAEKFPAEAEVDELATRMAQRNLDEKIRQGYYLPAGNDLLLAGGLKNGILTINGKRIPL